MIKSPPRHCPSPLTSDFVYDKSVVCNIFGILADSSFEMCVGWAVTGWTVESGRSQLLSSVSPVRAGPGSLLRLRRLSLAFTMWVSGTSLPSLPSISDHGPHWANQRPGSGQSLPMRGQDRGGCPPLARDQAQPLSERGCCCWTLAGLGWRTDKTGRG